MGEGRIDGMSQANTSCLYAVVQPKTNGQPHSQIASATVAWWLHAVAPRRDIKLEGVHRSQGSADRRCVLT